jgi:hypothetical protein
VETEKDKNVDLGRVVRGFLRPAFLVFGKFQIIGSCFLSSHWTELCTVLTTALGLFNNLILEKTCELGK